MIFTNLKKKKEKDRVLTSIFRSFLKKLSKDKEYILVEDLIKVENPDQTFKVFERGAFDEEIYMLEGISDILGSLFKRESLELE